MPPLGREIGGFVTHHRYAVSLREIEQAIRRNAQRLGGSSPGHFLGAHRIEDQEEPRTFGCVRIAAGRWNGDRELHGLDVHRDTSNGRGSGAAN